MAEILNDPYAKLIVTDRLRKTSIAGRTVDDEMLSDKARIVTSTAFRRLQVKAQVFSLEQNAAVRTRLTHTLEVATYGELIARKAAEKLMLPANTVFPFVTLVQSACLLHDLGNPPFGHLGEFAICSWFENHEHDIKKRWSNHGLTRSVIDGHFYGLKHFDGNPQTWRIVTRLQRWKDEFGLNLTLPLLASITKYLDVKPGSGTFCKKAGFFETERKRVLTVWKTLGLRLQGTTPMQRFPLTFLMEAADDISYCLSDIEDAIEKRIVQESAFLAEVPEVLRPHLDDKNGSTASFLGFKTSLTRWLVETAAKLYVDHHNSILNGIMASSLLENDSQANSALKWLKMYTKKNIFRSREAIHVELSGFRVLTDLLNFFSPLILAGSREFERLLPTTVNEPQYGELPLEQRMFSLLPRKHLDAYYDDMKEEPVLEPILRARLIVDYIAGMTDTHAVKIFRMLSGIAAGGVDV